LTLIAFGGDKWGEIKGLAPQVPVPFLHHSCDKYGKQAQAATQRSTEKVNQHTHPKYSMP